MFRAVATIEEGTRIHEVQTAVFDSIREVIHEIGKLGKDGRIATCAIWMKVKKTWTCVKSVTMK